MKEVKKVKLHLSRNSGKIFLVKRSRSPCISRKVEEMKTRHVFHFFSVDKRGSTGAGTEDDTEADSVPAGEAVWSGAYSGDIPEGREVFLVKPWAISICSTYCS